MMPKKILGLAVTGVAIVFVVYSAYNLILQAARSWENFYIVSLLLFLCAALFGISRIEIARIFVATHSKVFLRLGLSLIVVSLLILPLIVVGIFRLFPDLSPWLLPDWAAKYFAFGIGTLGIVGLLLAMLPAYLVFAEHLRTIGKRQR